MVAAGECGAAFLAHDVVEIVGGFVDALPAGVRGQAVQGDLQAEPDAERAGDNGVRQLQVFLLRRGDAPGQPGEVIESAGAGDGRNR